MPAPATERATATVVAPRGVTFHRRTLPAETLGAGDDHLILRWISPGRRHRELLLERGDVVAPCLAVLEPAEAVVATPLGPHSGRRVDRRHPVDERPATDAGAGEHRDRAIPRGEQAVVQIQAAEGVELVARHRRLVHERTCLEDHDRSPRLGQRRSDDAATGTRTDDDDVRLERHRLVGRTDVEGQGERHDRRPIGGHRRELGLVADHGVARIARRVGTWVRVREERHQLAECRERRPTGRERRRRPAQEIAFARARRHRGEPGRSASQDQVREARLHQPQQSMELADLLGVRGAFEGFDGQPRAAARVSPDERLRDLGESRQLAFRPGPHVKPGRPPSLGRAMVRSGAAGLRDNRARSRPGSACATG